MNLECSSKGDKRFSAFYARIKKYGNRSIEEIYQNSKRDEYNRVPGKGKKVKYMFWEGKYYSPKHLSNLYSFLWKIYFEENPSLLEYASKFDTFTDMFRGKSINCQADVISYLVKKYKEVM